jgi:glucosamine 6-phosphate synthetase-like amidotransferase/phosphosugar isomerase protein
VCGIFGVISADKSKVKLGRLSQGVVGAILESERRGKDSSGVLSIMKDEVIVAKSPNRAKYLVKTEEFKQVVSEGNLKFLSDPN